MSALLSAGRVRQVMCGRVSQGLSGVMACRSTQFQRDAAAASRGLALVYPAQGFDGSGESGGSSGSSWSGGGIGGMGSSSGSGSSGSSGVSDGSGGSSGSSGGGSGGGDGSASSWGSGAGAGVGSGWSDGGGWSSGAYEAEAAHGAHSAAVESDGRPWRAGGEPCGWTKRRRSVEKRPPRPLLLCSRLRLACSRSCARGRVPGWLGLGGLVANLPASPWALWPPGSNTTG